MRERSVERMLTDGVQRLGGRCVKLAPVSAAGLPDRLVLLPGGRSVFVELKAEGGKLSTVQELWLERLTELGFRAISATGPSGVRALLKELEGTVDETATVR